MSKFNNNNADEWFAREPNGLCPVYVCEHPNNTMKLGRLFRWQSLFALSHRDSFAIRDVPRAELVAFVGHRRKVVNKSLHAKRNPFENKHTLRTYDPKIRMCARIESIGWRMKPQTCVRTIVPCCRIQNGQKMRAHTIPESEQRNAFLFYAAVES